jgi:GntR family transcriptional regulator, histidine utilization repressor
MSQPLYEAVKQHVLEHIRDGRWQPGDKIPSENELVRDLSVSRMTANRALKELSSEGYLLREHGRGTFVAPRRVRGHPLEVRSIAEDIRARGELYSMKLLCREEIEGSAEVLEQMKLSPRSKLIHLKLVHKADGIPLQLEDRYVRSSLAPELLTLDFSVISPTEYLLNKVPLHQAEHIVRADIPSKSTAAALEMSEQDAVLIIHRRTFSDGAVASIAKLYHPGSRFELSGAFEGEGR